MFNSNVYYEFILDEWLNNKKKFIKSTTFYKYQYVIENNIKPYIGKIKFKKIDNENIKNIYKNDKIMNLSDSTKNLIYIIINSSLKFGVEKNIENLFHI